MHKLITCDCVVVIRNFLNIHNFGISSILFFTRSLGIYFIIQIFKLEK